MSVIFGWAVGLVEVRVHVYTKKKKKKSSTQSSKQQKQMNLPAALSGQSPCAAELLHVDTAIL